MPDQTGLDQSSKAAATPDRQAVAAAAVQHRQEARDAAAAQLQSKGTWKHMQTVPAAACEQARQHILSCLLHLYVQGQASSSFALAPQLLFLAQKLKRLQQKQSE